MISNEPIRRGRSGRRVSVFFAGWGVVAAAMLTLGCAGRSGRANRPGILHGPGEAVVITRAGEELGITWKTRAGDVYTVVYKDGPGTHVPWKPLPGYERVPGTGESQTIRLPTWPGDRRRFNVISASVRRQAPRSSRARTP